MDTTYLQKIKQSGLKLTPKRKAIVEFFARRLKTLTPEDVYGHLKTQFKHCGLPSVYRNLESLASCGILDKIQKFDNKRHYGLCPNEKQHHHHHVICVQCGSMGEFEACDILNCKEINGYKIVDHYLQINGICPDCQVKGLKEYRDKGLKEKKDKIL